jgi:CHAD domain-containing protein
MSGSDVTERNASGEIRINEIVSFEPAHIGAEVDLDLAAVEITVVDEGGAGYSALLAGDQCLTLIVRLCDALADLSGKGTTQRGHAAQLLIRTAVEAVGARQREIARAIGVDEARLSNWSTGRQAPSAERLHRLRRHVRNLLTAQR